MESVKDYAIFRLDADGHISTWNTGVEFIIGYRAEDILGRSYSCLYPAVDAEQRLAQRALQATIKHGRTEQERPSRHRHRGMQPGHECVSGAPLG